MASSHADHVSLGFRTQALQDEIGGWESREIIDVFEGYARRCMNASENAPNCGPPLTKPSSLLRLVI